MSDQLTRQQSALDLSKQRQNDLAIQEQTLERERRELEETVATEKEKVSLNQAEAHKVDVEFVVLAEKVKAKDEQVQKTKETARIAREQVNDSKRKLMVVVADSADLNSRLAGLESRIQSATNQAARVATQIAGFNEELEKAREEASRLGKSAADTREKVGKLKNQVNESRERVKNSEDRRREAQRERDRTDRCLTQIKSRLQSLQELMAAHEGFGQGAKASLEYASKLGQQDKIKTVADAIDIKTGFEQALNGWLEGKIEDLVSEDKRFAQKILQTLKENKQGRVSLYVTESPKSTNADEVFCYETLLSILEKNGFQVVSPLSSLARLVDDVTGEARNILKDLLARVCVVKSFSPVENFITKGGIERLREVGGWSLVSMDGDVLDCDGFLRGGTPDVNEALALITRKRTITELSDEVASIEKDLRTAELKVIQTNNEVAAEQVAFERLRSDLQQLEIEAAALDRDVHQSKRALQNLEMQQDLAKADQARIKEETDQDRRALFEAEESRKAVVFKREELEVQITENELNASRGEIALTSEEAELQVLKIEEASLRERSVSFKKEAEATRLRLVERERRLGDISESLERAESEREQFAGSDFQINQKIKQLNESLENAKRSLVDVKIRLEDASRMLNGALEQMKHLHQILEEKAGRANQVALEVERISGELNHIVKNLEEKYGQGCLDQPSPPIQEEMSAPVVTTEMTIEEEQLLGEQVERLRDRIRRLGEVNVMAVEEYDEVKKRYDKLAGEKADLEKSLEDLKEAIEHINKTSEDRFRKAFDSIAERFERLFPIIFGGGQAKLSLVYPEGSTDILEAGVDILAQPPGKKIVNITLLSGGEKALTAVSLIFAIFMVKPSPFCILDEVDAPLDDANIGKFNALLREMSAKSQFILITHNKKTMELNDTLYGVTMEEPGVSKMISIEMN